MSKFKLASALSLALMLGACGTIDVAGGYLFSSDNPQDMAGLVSVEYKFCENELGARELCGATMTDGKEQAQVDLKWKINQDGTMSIDYTATDSRAFQAFATRADYQKALGIELGGKVFDALQSAINPVSVGN